jgi:hypothetical protein
MQRIQETAGLGFGYIYRNARMNAEEEALRRVYGVIL